MEKKILNSNNLYKSSIKEKSVIDLMYGLLNQDNSPIEEMELAVQII